VHRGAWWLFQVFDMRFPPVFALRLYCKAKKAHSSEKDVGLSVSVPLFSISWQTTVVTMCIERHRRLPPFGMKVGICSSLSFIPEPRGSLSRSTRKWLSAFYGACSGSTSTVLEPHQPSPRSVDIWILILHANTVLSAQCFVCFIKQVWKSAWCSEHASELIMRAPKQ
jgi:hypothetical protein